jgi:uncharacterized protein
VILVDTRGLLANCDGSDSQHRAAAQALAQPQRRILSPFVLAELDYLVSKLAGQAAELMVLEDVARGTYELEPFEAHDIALAKAVIERYAALGLADASIVVLAERHNCQDLLTLDERHFRATRGPQGRAFRLLPLDAA